MHQHENKHQSYDSLLETVNSDDFERGKAGCTLPEDLDTNSEQHYTYRRLLPLQERTPDRHAEDLAIRVVKVSPWDNGVYYMVPVKPIYRVGDSIQEDRPIDCTVAADGMVINQNYDDFPEVELGYFLPGERLEEDRSETTVEMARVVLRHSAPEPLKYFTFD